MLPLLGFCLLVIFLIRPEDINQKHKHGVPAHVIKEKHQSNEEEEDGGITNEDLGSHRKARLFSKDEKTQHERVKEALKLEMLGDNENREDGQDDEYAEEPEANEEEQEEEKEGEDNDNQEEGNEEEEEQDEDNNGEDEEDEDQESEDKEDADEVADADAYEEQSQPDEVVEDQPEAATEEKQEEDQTGESEGDQKNENVEQLDDVVDTKVEDPGTKEGGAEGTEQEDEKPPVLDELDKLFDLAEEEKTEHQETNAEEKTVETVNNDEVEKIFNLDKKEEEEADQGAEGATLKGKSFYALYDNETLEFLQKWGVNLRGLQCERHPTNATRIQCFQEDEQGRDLCPEYVDPAYLTRVSINNLFHKSTNSEKLIDPSIRRQTNGHVLWSRAKSTSASRAVKKTIQLYSGTETRSAGVRKTRAIALLR